MKDIVIVLILFARGGHHPLYFVRAKKRAKPVSDVLMPISAETNVASPLTTKEADKAGCHRFTR